MSGKVFNVTGLCIPDKHYMVDTSEKLDRIITEYIEQNAYFTINCARQYGKSTTLELLYNRLKKKYVVLDISFEASDDCFTSIYALALGFMSKVYEALLPNSVPQELLDLWKKPISETLPLDDLGKRITSLCKVSSREIILMVDEVDRAADNQLFLMFLGLLRKKYLRRSTGRDYTFKSVILSGVHDIKNLKMKLSTGESYGYNSPWNIAAAFNVDMSFSATEIMTMLAEYEEDHQTGMDIISMAKALFDYTGGYPFLVSCLCKILSEEAYGWNAAGLQEAIKQLLHSTNTLFDDIIKNLENIPDFRVLIERILVQGVEVSYILSNPEVNRGVMYGIFGNKDGNVRIANQIFESYIYEYLIGGSISG